MIKNKKRGFTLAEILITLGVIGVIAALTIPQIVDYTMKSKIEGNLARAVEQVEIGCQNLIQYANDNTSDSTYANGISVLWTDSNSKLYTEGSSNRHPLVVSGSMFKQFAPFYGLDFFGDSSTGNKDDYKNYKKELKDKNSAVGSIVTGIEQYFLGLWKMKNSNAIVSLDYSFSWPATNQGAGYFPIFIDANGIQKPNKYGRDVFFFGLSDSCKMIPAGSQRFINDHTVYGNMIPLATTACKNDGITNGLSCTTRVVENGFKINYW